MNREQVQYFADSYGKMSDEALAHLLVTRAGHLSEEAECALRQILAKRNPIVLKRATEEIARDMKAQEQHASKVAEVHQAGASVAQWALRGLCVFICLRGLFDILNGVPNAVIELATGFVFLIAVELRRLVRWVLREMFNMS